MNKPLKLMQVMGAGKAGGAENYFIRYILEMQKHAEIMPVVKKGSWAESRLLNYEIPHETLPFKNGVFNWGTKKQFKKLADAWQPDIIQTWMNRASSSIPQGLQAPVVARLGGYYKLKNYKNANWLAGNTEDIRQYVIKEGWPENFTHHMPNFYPVPENPSKTLREEVRQQLGINQNANVLIFVGRLHKVKGIDLILKSLPNLQEGTQLIIVGEGPEKESLKTLARELKVDAQVHFWGWETNISKPAAAADIWVVSSRHEPFGSVVLEAWGNQVPLVTTASEGPAATVKPDENALMTPLDNVEALTNAILKFQENPEMAQKMAKNGFEYLNQHFTAQVLAPKCLEFYHHVVNDWQKRDAQ